MHGELPPKAVWPSPTIVRKRTLPSCVARRLAPRYGVAGSYVVATSSIVGDDLEAVNGPRNASFAWIGQSAVVELDVARC